MNGSLIKKRKKQAKAWISHNKSTWEIICSLKKASKDEINAAKQVVKDADIKELSYILTLMETLELI